MRIQMKAPGVTVAAGAENGISAKQIFKRLPPHVRSTASITLGDVDAILKLPREWVADTVKKAVAKLDQPEDDENAFLPVNVAKVIRTDKGYAEFLIEYVFDFATRQEKATIFDPILKQARRKRTDWAADLKSKLASFFTKWGFKRAQARLQEITKKYGLLDLKEAVVEAKTVEDLVDLVIQEGAEPGDVDFILKQIKGAPLSTTASEEWEDENAEGLEGTEESLDIRAKRRVKHKPTAKTKQEARKRAAKYRANKASVKKYNEAYRRKNKLKIAKRREVLKSLPPAKVVAADQEGWKSREEANFAYQAFMKVVKSQNKAVFDSIVKSKPKWSDRRSDVYSVAEGDVDITLNKYANVHTLEYTIDPKVRKASNSFELGDRLDFSPIAGNLESKSIEHLAKIFCAQVKSETAKMLSMLDNTIKWVTEYRDGLKRLSK